MKKLILLILLSPVFATLHAQNLTVPGDQDDNNNQVLTLVQQMPKFKGDLNQYLARNIKYPEKERKAGITGTVYITFVVEKNGAVSNAKVLRGVLGGPGLDAEALRVVSTMPDWTPGMNNGKPVRVQFNIPIRFKLQ